MTVSQSIPDDWVELSLSSVKQVQTNLILILSGFQLSPT